MDANDLAWAIDSALREREGKTRLERIAVQLAAGMNANPNLVTAIILSVGPSVDGTVTVNDAAFQQARDLIARIDNEIP